MDHLELAVAQISAAYSSTPPAELFLAARTYRHHIDHLLQGPHTLREARQLYTFAGWLSETLAWLSHDLGQPLAADAYCIDAFTHAEEAGHDELCAWALDARASIAFHGHCLPQALQAAEQGVSIAPAEHPIRVRLQAQYARVLAHQGRSHEYDTALSRALRYYDQLPASPPTRFGKQTLKLVAYAITSYPASSSLALQRFDVARIHAERALSEHMSANARDRSPSRAALAKLDLAIAMAGLGDPSAAVRLGQEALQSPRVVMSVQNRANGLLQWLSTSFPNSRQAVMFEASVREARRTMRTP